MTRAKMKGGKRGASVVAAVIAGILAVEGGYVNDVFDPGGETNHGITIGTARAYGYTGPMAELTSDQAWNIYYDLYFVKPGLEPIVERSPAILEEVADTGVNTGPSRAGRWLQESLNHFNRGGKDYRDIAEDGQIGPETMRAFEALVAKRGLTKACQLLIKSADAKQAQHYMRIMASNPNLERYAVGWFDHRIGNVPLEEC